MIEYAMSGINIPVKVGDEKWRKCFHKAASKAPILGCQEIFNPNQKQALREEATKKGWGKAGLANSPNPVFWDKTQFRKKHVEVTRLHRRNWLTRKFPGFNDARYMTEVIFEDLRGEGLPDVVGISSHWVPKQRVGEVFRSFARGKSKKKIVQAVKEHTSQGRVVLFTADTNIYKRIRLAGIKFMRAIGIDKVGIAVPKGYKVVHTSFSTYEAPTDHRHGIVGKATVVKA